MEGCQQLVFVTSKLDGKQRLTMDVIKDFEFLKPGLPSPNFSLEVMESTTVSLNRKESHTTGEFLMQGTGSSFHDTSNLSEASFDDKGVAPRTAQERQEKQFALSAKSSVVKQNHTVDEGESDEDEL